MSSLSNIGIPAGRLVIDAAQVRKARVMHKKIANITAVLLAAGIAIPPRLNLSRMAAGMRLMPNSCLKLESVPLILA